MHAWIALLVALLACTARVQGQLSAPVSSDSHISVDGNKFLERKADFAVATGKAPDG
jgi:hypothetical protein